MKLKKLLIPIIIIAVILIGLSYPLSTYLKDYIHSKELYNKASDIYASGDTERHSKALKLLNKIPAVLTVLK